MKEEDLLKRLTEYREKLKDFRFGLAGGKIKNLKEGRNLRKEIARVLTEFSLRHISSK